MLSAEELSCKGQIPRVSAKSDNNGILGYLDSEKMLNTRHFENFISVNFFGSDGGIFYHPYKASVEMKVHTLKIPKTELNGKTGAFICTSLYKVFGGFGYGNQLSSSKLKTLDFKVKLPVKSGNIDFDFMERFISVLEAESIAKLESYMIAAGLKDYRLTLEEEQILDKVQKGDLSWGSFKFQDIFDNIAQGRRLKKDDQLSGNIPFVMSGTTNTGVVNYISNPVSTFPKNSITVDIFGSAFYRGYEFGAGDDTGAYWSSEDKYSKETMLFFTASMDKALDNKFDFGNKLRSSKSLDLEMLVLTKDNQPDLSSMSLLISATQKLVIKDVVEYTDLKIAAHNQIVKAG